MKIAVFVGSEILRIVNCPDEVAPMQAREGESWVELPEGFKGTDETHHVVDGKVVPK